MQAQFVREAAVLRSCPDIAEHDSASPMFIAMSAPHDRLPAIPIQFCCVR
jgi:hypothetical protein